MSGRTDAFRSHADWLMSDAQCASLIVNGPLLWSGRAPRPSSLLTRPLADNPRSEHHRTAICSSLLLPSSTLCSLRRTAPCRAT
jgi:hypothetical protein